MSIFDIQISIFERVHITVNPVHISLKRWLRSSQHRRAVQQIRNAKKSGISKDDYQAMKKKLFPVATISGTFSQRKDESLITHSGFVCIDIDGKDNRHIGNFSELKDELKKLPYSAYIGRSVGGDGYYMLFRIKHPDKHLQHYNAILHGLRRAGIKCDQTSDLSRCRFYSYDPKAYFNEQAEIFPYLLEEPKPEPDKPPAIRKKRRFTDTDTYPALIDAIIESRTDITAGAFGVQGWKTWRNIALAIAGKEGDAGRGDFHAISAFYPGYSQKEADAEYTKALKDCNNPNFNRDIGYLFKVAQSHGITYKQHRPDNIKQPATTPHPNGFNPYTGEIFDVRGYPASWDMIEPPQPGTAEYSEMIQAELNDSDSNKHRAELLAELDPKVAKITQLFDAVPE